ncbi:MAG: hypothetical protein RRY34_09960 [Victivallaceae bacterium]
MADAAEAALAEDILSQNLELKQKFDLLKQKIATLNVLIGKEAAKAGQEWQNIYLNRKGNIFDIDGTLEIVLTEVMYRYTAVPAVKAEITDFLKEVFIFAQLKYKLLQNNPDIAELRKIKSSQLISYHNLILESTFLKNPEFAPLPGAKLDCENVLAVIQEQGEALLDELAELPPDSPYFKPQIDACVIFLNNNWMPLMAMGQGKLSNAIRFKTQSYDIELKLRKALADYFLGNPDRIETLFFMLRGVPPEIFAQRAGEIAQLKSEINEITQREKNFNGSNYNFSEKLKNALEANKLPEAVYLNKIISGKEKLENRLSELRKKVKK